MGKPGRKLSLSPDEIAQAVALRRDGLPLRIIAERLGTTGPVISRTIQRWEWENQTAIPAPDNRGRPRSDANQNRPVSGHRGVAPPTKLPDEVADEIEEDTSPLPTTTDEVLDELKAKRLPELSALIRKAFATGNLALYHSAIKIELDMVRRIRAAMPPPAPDPQDNPDYTAARDEVRAMLDALARKAGL